MSRDISSFADVHRVIEGFPRSSKSAAYSLGPMRELLAFLGNPERQFKVVHVAGTSGKTSTAYYTAALLAGTGKKVGLTVSPHIDEVNERVQIGLVPLPEAEFCRRFSDFLERIKDCRVVPNYFELFIAFAFWEFAARRVDYAVVEVGIGGLIDSTNVFDDPEKVCIITDIGFDHTRLLGNTLPEIAAQKAGVIHLRNAVFCRQQADEVIDVIRSQARKQQADLHILTTDELGPEFDFLPLFQRRNFGLSLAAARYVAERDGLSLDDEIVAKAARAFIPARMEIEKLHGRTVILDIAHNPQKLHALLESVHARYPGQPVAALVRMPSREGRMVRTTASLKEVTKGLDYIILTSLAEEGDPPDTTFDEARLAAVCREAGFDAYQFVPDPRQAMDTLLARPEPVLLVTGSTFLLNHIRPLLKESRE